MLAEKKNCFSDDAEKVLVSEQAHRELQTVMATAEGKALCLRLAGFG